MKRRYILILILILTYFSSPQATAYDAQEYIEPQILKELLVIIYIVKPSDGTAGNAYEIRKPFVINFFYFRIITVFLIFLVFLPVFLFED